MFLKTQQEPQQTWGINLKELSWKNACDTLIKFEVNSLKRLIILEKINSIFNIAKKVMNIKTLAEPTVGKN